MRIILLLIMFLFPADIYAASDPLAVPNNRIGIHITDDHDLEAAAALVNSQGGEWGYVTVVIREDDRKQDKWQQTFNKMRELKLIPLVRLATTMSPQGWAAPREHEAQEWAAFLNSLNWVIKNRYIILFNEPNHAKEWGGYIAPHEYASISRVYTETLKSASPDYFILPAGFDAMAPNGKETMEISKFFTLMYRAESNVFKHYDGWTSHAYPNPHFAGLPDASGKTTVRGYKWETNYLRQYGLKSPIPIFITETGWNSSNLKPSKNQSVYQKLEQYWNSVFASAFSDQDIVAVTPFILRYLNPPFTGFSWIDPATDQPLPHYRTVQNLSKIKGMPVQELGSRVIKEVLPHDLIVDSKYVFSIEFQNTGQSIWNQDDYQLEIGFPSGFVADLIDPVTETKPQETVQLHYAFTTPSSPGIYTLSFSLKKGAIPFGESVTREVKIIPPPSFLVKLQLWYKRVSSGEDFTLLVYDEGDLVKEIHPVTVTGGQALIDSVKGLIPGTRYRFVLTKPYYLPRQVYAVMSQGQTVVSFERLLPYDFYPDGQFTVRDIWNAIRHPLNTIRLLSL